MKLLLGSDPEFFVKRDGELISAHGLVEGTKENPKRLKSGYVQVDGMALEINTKPVQTLRGWLGVHERLIKEVRGLLGEEYELLFSPSVNFTNKIMESTPAFNKRLGCEPDYNAWTGEMNETPDAGDTNMRTGAGHIHFGWNEEMVDPLHPQHMDACMTLTKALDEVLAPLSRLWDKDDERRKLYGNLGAFRPKPYGMEYRVLSNAWVNDTGLASVVFLVCQDVFKHLMSGKEFKSDLSGIKSSMNSDDWDIYRSGHSCLSTNTLAKLREVYISILVANDKLIVKDGVEYEIIGEAEEEDKAA